MSTRRVRLGDVCVVDWGNTNLTKSSYAQDGSFLAVSASGPDGRIGHAEHNAFVPVLSAIGAQCGRMFMPTEPFTAIKNTMTLTPHEGALDAWYLYYLMTTVQLPRRGAAQPFMSKGDVQSFEIDLPVLAEQRRIVALLDEATQLIADLESAYAQTETKYAELARSVLEAALKSVSCDRVERLGEICEIEIGRTPPRADPRQWDQDGSSNNVWVSIADMTAVSGGVISSSKERISDLAAASGRVVRAGTLLMSFKLSIGKLAITACDLYTNEAIAALCLPTNSRVSQRYLYHYLSSVDWMAEARGNEKVKGATLNKAKLKELRVPVPTSEDQIRISTHIDNLKIEIESGMTSARRRLEWARDLRQSMLEAAFRGEL